MKKILILTLILIGIICFTACDGVELPVDVNSTPATETKTIEEPEKLLNDTLLLINLKDNSSIVFDSNGKTVLDDGYIYEYKDNYICYLAGTQMRKSLYNDYSNPILLKKDFSSDKFSSTFKSRIIEGCSYQKIGSYIIEFDKDFKIHHVPSPYRTIFIGGSNDKAYYYYSSMDIFALVLTSKLYEIDLNKCNSTGSVWEDISKVVKENIDLEVYPNYYLYNNLIIQNEDSNVKYIDSKNNSAGVLYSYPQMIGLCEFQETLENFLVYDNILISEARYKDGGKTVYFVNFTDIKSKKSILLEKCDYKSLGYFFQKENVIVNDIMYSYRDKSLFVFNLKEMAENKAEKADNIFENNMSEYSFDFEIAGVYNYENDVYLVKKEVGSFSIFKYDFSNNKLKPYIENITGDFYDMKFVKK